MVWNGCGELGLRDGVVWSGDVGLVATVMVYHSSSSVNAKRSEFVGTHKVQEYINEHHIIFKNSQMKL